MPISRCFSFFDTSRPQPLMPIDSAAAAFPAAPDPIVPSHAALPLPWRNTPHPRGRKAHSPLLLGTLHVHGIFMRRLSNDASSAAAAAPPSHVHAISSS